MAVLTSEAVAAAAERYRRRGYKITLDPSKEMLPPVENYVPDFVATRDDERIAVEVKNRDSLIADAQLMRLAEQFRGIPGWRLDIAVIGEEEKAHPEALLSATEIDQRLRAAEKLAEDGDYAAAILLLWTVIEAIVYSRLKNEDDDKPISPNRLPKIAYSIGLVEAPYLPVMQRLVRIRNEVVHGRKPRDVSKESYEAALQLVKHLI